MYYAFINSEANDFKMGSVYNPSSGIRVAGLRLFSFLRRFLSEGFGYP